MQSTVVSLALLLWDEIQKTLGSLQSYSNDREGLSKTWRLYDTNCKKLSQLLSCRRFTKQYLQLLNRIHLWPELYEPDL